MVIVEPNMRQQHVGTRLLQKLEEHLRAEGAKEVFLETSTNNPTGQKFYKSLGFQQISTRKDYYQEEGAFYDALIFKKIL